jgi:hypothetical protein
MTDTNQVGLVKTKIINYSESDHKYDTEFIDMIPELGDVIARLGTNLKMPGNSRTYGRIKRKGICIGRRTLLKYINDSQFITEK